MSAFVCSPEHIKELAAYAASPGRVQGCTNVPNHYLQYHGGMNMTGAYGAELATYYANVLGGEHPERPIPVPGQRG